MTAGDYTSDNYNGIALYSYSGGTLTLVASTTNDGNIWKGATGTAQTKAFSSTYSAAPGIYYVAFLWNASATITVPVLGAASDVQTPASYQFFTNSAKIGAAQQGLNSFLSSLTMSSLTNGSAIVFAALY